MDNKRPRYGNRPGDGNHYVHIGQQSDSAAAAATWPFTEPASPEDRQFVVSAINQIFDNTSTGTIPSPLPATVSRRDLPELISNRHEYRVCEKSDGERALMFICQRGCFITNRKFQIQRLKDDPIGLYSSLITQPNEMILLDGEIIENFFSPQEDDLLPQDQKQHEQAPFPPQIKQLVKQHDSLDDYLMTQVTNKRYVYCMFDIAYYIDKDVQSLPLDERLKHLGFTKHHIEQTLLPLLKEQFPIARYPQLTSDNAYMQYYIWEHAPLRIETKDFRASGDMFQILQSVLIFGKIEHGYLYYNRRKQLKAKNDGFIFTPKNNNYLMKSNESTILKYKWPGLNTVDFHITHPFYDPDGKLILYSHAYDIHQRKIDFEFAHISLTHESKEFLNKHIQDNKIAVVECNYVQGVWKIKHVRSDKHKGNFFSTVLSCMEAMVDNLLPEEVAKGLNRGKLV